MSDVSQLSDDELLRQIAEQVSPQKPVQQYQIGEAGLPAAVGQVARDFNPLTQMAVGTTAGVENMAMRLKQLAGRELTPKDIQAVKMDRALIQNSPMASIGSALPITAASIPFGGSTLPGASAVGFGIGATSEPVLQGESGMRNAARGALWGAGANIAGHTLARAIQPIIPSKAVQTLQSEGVQPTPGQALAASDATGWGKKLANALSSVEEKLQSLPGVGDIISGARQGAVSDLNRAALARATPSGMTPTQNIGRAGIEDTYNLISDKYNTALDAIKTVKPDNQFAADLSKRLGNAVAGLTREQKGGVQDAIATIVTQRVADNGGVVSAQLAKTIDSDLGSIARQYQSSATASERLAGNAIEQAQKAWRDLIRRNAPNAQVVAALDDANRAFANMVRVRDASTRATRGTGEFSAAQLAQAVRANDPTRGKVAFSKGNALMQDLSDPAQQALQGRIGESGTTPRALAALLLGGGAVANQYFGGPEYLTALALSPLMYSRPGSAYMTGNLIPGQAESAAFVRSATPHASRLAAALKARNYQEQQ